MMNRIALAALALLLVVAVCGDALSHVDPVTNEDYSGWKQPNGSSCCNNNDCKPTQARFNAERGMWEALFDGKWIVIPHERVMKFEAKDGNAHLCAMYEVNEAYQSTGAVLIFCFTPPAARG